MTRARKLDQNGGFAEPSDSFCSRFVEDIGGPCACRPSFRAIEGSRTIDIPASFSPKSWLAIAGKMANVGVAAFTVYLGLGKNPEVFWLAYLTNWNVTISTLYLVLSFFNSLLTISGPPVGQAIVNYRVKITWILYSLSANIGLVVVIAYWTLLFDGVLNMPTIFPHGILTAVVLLDGSFINSIPIRLRHYIEFVVPFALLYVLWSYLHGLFDIGNPDYTDEDPETNDDLIYDVLDWKKQPGMTAIIVVVMVFVLSPILQVLLWTLSGFRRRYEADDKEAQTYIEMGSGTNAEI